jgi:transmembrane sensor
MKWQNSKKKRSGKEYDKESLDALLADNAFWKDTSEFDQDMAAVKINSRIGRSIIGSGSRGRKLALMRYAALILLVIMATFAWYYYQLPVQVQNQGNEVQAYVLPDGTEVLLERGSSLKYTRDFARHSRKIELEGKAFFNVKENPALPFELSYQDQSILVLGTEFIVEAGDELTQLYLLEGNILWQSPKGEVELKAGEKLEIGSDTFVKKTESPAADHPLRGQELLIDNWTLAEAVDKINEGYAEEVIRLADRKSANTCRIHTRFRTGQLEDFIEEIELLFKINIRSYKGSFTIEEINCNS